jgi:hypothetical protein
VLPGDYRGALVVYVYILVTMPGRRSVRIVRLPFKFSGDLNNVAIQLSDSARSADDEAEIKRN